MCHAIPKLLSHMHAFTPFQHKLAGYAVAGSNHVPAMTA